LNQGAYRDVIEYYNRCHVHYRTIWRAHKTHSLHLGFHDKDHTGRAEAITNMIRVLADTARVKPGDRILDAGCGIGGSAVWLAKNRGAKVVGIDINQAHLTMARSFAKKSLVEDAVEFLSRDFVDTGFPDESFDVIWGIESPCHTNDKKDFLSEVKRLLKPNGRLVVADYFLARERINPREARTLRLWLSGWAVPNLANAKWFRGYLEDLGFENIIFRDATKNVTPSSNALYFASILFFPGQKLLEFYRIAGEVQVKNVMAAYYQHVALKKGLWLYGIFCGEKATHSWLPAD
jgi:ubiquinone/menaquinone biosynthesis C-methylase UbiE